MVTYCPLSKIVTIFTSVEREYAGGRGTMVVIHFFLNILYDVLRFSYGVVKNQHYKALFLEGGGGTKK